MSSRTTLIETINVPKKLRKRTTVANVIYYDTIEVYGNRVSAQSENQSEMTWYYKDYNGIDIINANLNSQFSQIVFLTGMNSKNRAIGIDVGSTQNINAIKDSNRLLFCGGMFSYAAVNEFTNSIGATIKNAFETYKNESDEQNAESGSAADEIVKFKLLLDDGTITQEEFDQKKKQLLGL